MMADLIDRAALIHRLCAERDEVQIEHACDIGYHNGLNMAVSMTINAPTIDPESLRPQGKWEWREEWETHHETRSCDLISCGWYCTKCGIELGEYLTKGTGVNIILDLDIRKPTLAVCPNCGAKMKGAKNNG